MTFQKWYKFHLIFCDLFLCLYLYVLLLANLRKRNTRIKNLRKQNTLSVFKWNAQYQ